jgi:hypothetical protein
MPKAQNSSWNVNSNISIGMEYFPYPNNNEGKEFNDVSGKDPYDLPDIPDGHYDSSISEVRDYGNLEKSQKRSGFLKKAVGITAVAVTAATLFSYINRVKPTIMDYSSSISSTSYSYWIVLKFAYKGTLYVKLSDGGDYTEQKEYPLELLEENLAEDGSYALNKKGSFDISSIPSGEFTLTISSNTGLGITELKKETKVKP